MCISKEQIYFPYWRIEIGARAIESQMKFSSETIPIIGVGVSVWRTLWSDQKGIWWNDAAGTPIRKTKTSHNWLRTLFSRSSLEKNWSFVDDFVRYVEISRDEIVPSVQLIGLAMQSLRVLSIILPGQLGVVSPLATKTSPVFRILHRFFRIVQVLQVVGQPSAREYRHRAPNRHWSLTFASSLEPELFPFSFELRGLPTIRKLGEIWKPDAKNFFATFLLVWSLEKLSWHE